MATRIYVGVAATKAGAQTQLYLGNSRSAAKTAVAADVNAGTHSKGYIISNMFPGTQVAAKNPAGT